MTIRHIGHSMFKIRGKDAVVITDPFNPKDIGISYPKQSADIVTVSHNHYDHNHLERIEEGYFLIDGAGEFEIKDVYIYGYPTYHDTKGGKERGENTIYLIKIDGFNILHLGDLGHKLKDSLAGEVSEADILIIPIGGTYTIDPEIATEVISQIEPKVVIPMHYKQKGMASSFDTLKTVEDFCKAMGIEKPERQEKLTLKSRSDLPDETTVEIL